MKPSDSDGDPQAPVRIVAHLVARLSDRFSFLRKLSRHAEGEGKKAGLVADILSAVMALYSRNPELVNELGGKLSQDIRAKQERRNNTNNGATL